MICRSCKDTNHGICLGGTWCDCQHKSGDYFFEKPVVKPVDKDE